MTVAVLRDYITRRKNKKSQTSNEVKNGCTNSRVRIEFEHPGGSFIKVFIVDIIEGPNYLDVQYRNINKIILFKNNFLINPNQKTTENFVKTITALLSISPDLNLVKDWFPQHEK